MYNHKGSIPHWPFARHLGQLVAEESNEKVGSFRSKSR
jgi:hypothetical protein